jgi:hypothetical protein
MAALKLAAIETHVADARTCCLNPATSTHRQMNDEELAAAGVPAGLVRLSCGLESSADLIADRRWTRRSRRTAGRKSPERSTLRAMPMNHSQKPCPPAGRSAGRTSL